ncbi:hypothetical protein M0R45_020409 [Rubus argutus]|uniref:F-box domain-containing protein n=1 Tax=Rubus argutus TaxID=59490 RepID=A0AAW1XAL8_RUBAR
MEDQRRWEDLNKDCLLNILGRIDMESLLLDVPFVCKSWYKATLNPSCWKHLEFPGNEKFDPWTSVNVDENIRGFQKLMIRLVSEYRIYGESYLDAVTIEAFEFVTDACPQIRTLIGLII